MPTLATVSADKMMVKARGPVWHQKQKNKVLFRKVCTVSTAKRHGVIPMLMVGSTGMARFA